MNPLNHPPVPNYRHPLWCSPDLCSTVGVDLVHLGLVDPLFPAEAGGGHVVTVRLERDDELGGDHGQVVFPASLELAVVEGDQVATVHLSAAETLAHGRRLVELGELMVATEGGAL